MLTTIQIHTEIKKELDAVKQDKETYEDVILRLLRQAEIQKRKNKQLMIEGCKEMAEESLKICKEFEAADWEVTEKYGGN